MPDQKEQPPEDKTPENKITLVAGGHILAPNSRNCPNCGAPPSEHEVRDYDIRFQDGAVHCKKCGTFVRVYDAS